MVEEVQSEETKEQVNTTFVGENLWAKWSEAEKAARRQELLDKSDALEPFRSRTDQYRDPEAAGKSGGFELRDAETQALLRSAGVELLAMAGRKILNGEFNLTRISFPIKCMSSQTMLQTMTGFATTLPVFMTKAARTSDPVERMKFVMCANMSWFLRNKQWLKPLNPILGETFQAFGQDGSKIFLEQSCHHPPRSHFLAEGPDDLYKMNGYLDFAIYAGMTSSTVQCNGYKEVIFADGGKIRFNQTNDSLSGLMIGTPRHQITGTVTYEDKANNLVGTIKMGAYTFSLQDYCWGEMHQNGKKVCTIEGTYCGYLDFDKVRYWDIRDQDQIEFKLAGEDPNSLPSNASKRSDGLLLINGTVEEAQAEKERLEELQRHDRKLREQAKERREKGGPKFKSQEPAEGE